MSDSFWGWSGDWGSRRRWSLADMLNFQLSSFVHHHKWLVDALKEAHAQCQIDRNAAVPKDRADILAGWIDSGVKYCVDSLNLKEAELSKTDLWVMTGNRHHTPMRWGDLFETLKRLCDEINVGIGRECFFHYRRDKAILLFRTKQQCDWPLLFETEAEWIKVIKSFPSAKQEILFGIDAFGFENNVACVFHMSRVAEIGLRAIGRERGIKSLRKKKDVPIEWGTWGNIFDALEPKIKELTQRPPGPQREAAVSFYKTVLSDLRAIQTLYRDPTMHFRSEYNEGEAQGAIFRVKSLMTVLAAKLSESSNGVIPWSAWKT
ncbi:MAG TPA: hypothetical protein VKS78_19025 [Roseiarcus sp.]|nr:hypothetical protein [Roseiarcus sp.]